MKKLILLLLMIKTIVPTSFAQIDIQGHRGCRGLMPENSIPAFLKAIDLGVNTIELDVVITKDNRVLVSHEPYMSGTICTKADGSLISENDEKKLNIFQMTYAETQAYDCGSKAHPKFPEQAKLNVKKALLEDVIESVESYLSSKNLKKVKYNIEIKSAPNGDDESHPKPDVFAKMLVAIVHQKGISDRTIIQSFDVRSIQEVKKLDSKITISYLIANANSLSKNLSKLGFKPDYYSPHFILVNEKLIKQLKSKDIKTAVWTVNEDSDIKKMIDLGVDAIITDYPDKVIRLLK
jgi:glycerophosphoryl diester phosphodiesterase